MVTVVLTYPTAENMDTRGMLTPGRGVRSSGRSVGALILPSFLPLCFVSGRKKPSSCDVDRTSGRCSHSYS